MVTRLTSLAANIFMRFGTPAWLAVALVPALIVAAGAARLGFGVVPATLDAKSGLSEFRQLAVGELLVDEKPALDDLYVQVAQVDAGIESATRFMRWVRRFSPAFSWLPAVHQEMAAGAVQMERAKEDIRIASVLLDSSTLLFESYSEMEAVLLTAGNHASIARLKSQAQDLEQSFSSGLKETEAAHSMGHAFSVGLQAPRVRALGTLVRELEGRMLTALDLGHRVSSLLVELLELADGAQPLVGQFVIDGTEPEEWTSETLRASLTAVNDRAQSANLRAEDLIGVIASTGQDDRLASRLATLGQVLAALHTVANAGLTALSAFDSGTVMTEESEGRLLNGSEGLGDIFDAFVEKNDDITDAIAQLAEARRILDDVARNGDWLSASSELSDVAKFVGDLHAGLQLVNSVAPVGRDILGGNGVRRYLVLGQSSDELRGTGGFVSGLWLVTFVRQRLEDVRYHDAVRVDDWDRLDLYPRAPIGLEDHMNARVWLLRDISWDPDFPTTARTAEDMYRIGQRLDVDGVVAINQWTLLRWIESLGEIASPEGGDPVTSRNLLSFLEQGTDRHGRAYMDLVLQNVLDTVTQAVSIPVVIRLASAMHDTLQARDMLVFFDDQDLQSVMGELGWDGSVRQDSMDYLYVVDSNVGWSKVDRNIQRDISYFVDLSRAPQPRATLTLGYRNHSGPGSSICEPQWLNRDTDYGQLKNACYWNFLRVYFPLEARLLTSTELPLPAYSVAVEIGRGVPGQNTGVLQSIHNRAVFSGLTSLEAGQRHEINLAYDLPASVVVSEGESLRYELLIQKQPGVRERRVEVELIPPGGYHLASSSISPVSTNGNSLRFTIGLTQDIVLNVEFVEDADGSS